LQLGPLRNIAGTAEVAGCASGAGLVGILAVCLTIYGIATYGNGELTDVKKKTLSGRELPTDELQTADGCVEPKGRLFARAVRPSAAVAHTASQPAQVGELHGRLAGGWSFGLRLGVRLHADSAVLLVGLPRSGAAAAPRDLYTIRPLARKVCVLPECV